MATDKSPQRALQPPGGRREHDQDDSAGFESSPRSQGGGKTLGDSASEASRTDQRKITPYVERKDMEREVKKPKPNSEAEAGDLDKSERETKPSSKVKGGR